MKKRIKKKLASGSRKLLNLKNIDFNNLDQYSVHERELILQSIQSRSGEIEKFSDEFLQKL